MGVHLPSLLGMRKQISGVTEDCSEVVQFVECLPEDLFSCI